MGKRITLIIVAVLVVAGLIVAAVYLSKNPDFATKPSEEESVVEASETLYILGTKEDKVPAVRVEVENENDSFIVTRDGDDVTTTQILGMEDFTLEDVPAVMTYATTLTAHDIIGSADDLDISLYGLDKPNTTVHITYQDNTTETLLIGDDAPGNSGIYAMTKSDPTIYLSTRSGIPNFQKGLADFVSRQLTPGEPEYSELEDAVLGGSCRPEEIYIQRLPEEDFMQASGIVLNSHKITAPLEASLDLTNGNDVIEQIFGLQADTVLTLIDEDTNLEDYGLEEPYSTAKITGFNPAQAEGQKDEPFAFTLLLSAPDSEGNVNVIREGTRAIFQISNDRLPWLESSAFDMMNKMVLIPFIHSVETLTLETPDTTYVFDLDNEKIKRDDGTEKDEVTIYYQGEALDTDNFKQFYQTLLAVKYDSDVEDDFTFDPDTATKLLTITYDYIAGGSDSLNIYESGARRALVALNDGVPKYMLTTHVDKILTDVKTLTEGGDVTAG